MDESLRILYHYAMGQLMEKKAKTYSCFFSQAEFEKNRATIFQITGAKRNILKKLDKI